ncbi:duodenase-1-like isoform X2 [Dermochelys coriacea]|uniref:duodenase-1-like isoform X2 n=1 Tax=Dermochelys coriacea TaxID=27794 RepID=UPI0018E70E01|nr:duodenase-1-like isoform X2 [Dermochelys coriacea]XP_043351927.1 duodenase-1-like isoform X2 [Dermochelys coriacea]XP_043351928.1 duodenase-1-like isoform X2 [Dermochelys coriacea]
MLLLLFTALLPFTAAFLLPPRPHMDWVIGYEEALLSSRPYMAYVQIGSTGSCGGFLIQEDVVVTAAHCNCNLGNIFVYLGVQDFMEPGQNWQRIKARHWVQHPDFNNENFDNDIMLLKLWRSAELNEWVMPIPLPEANHHVSPGSKCSVAGWGQTGVNTTTDRLLEAEQEVVSDGLCRERAILAGPSCAMVWSKASSPMEIRMGAPPAYTLESPNSSPGSVKLCRN